MGRWCGKWLLASILVGCQNNPTSWQVACSDVVLRPGGEGAPSDVGVAAAILPSVAIDLSRVEGTDHVSVELRTCGGALAATTTHAGGGSFLLDTSWYDKSAPAHCHRLTASAWNSRGRALGSAGARVRQGDFSVSGEVLDGSQPVSARVRLQLGDAVFEVDGNPQGRFSFEHLPGGMVWRASAREIVAPGQFPRLADQSPQVALDAAAPSLALQLNAVAGPPPLDSFEPDDTLPPARAPLAAGGAELHALAGKKDVDLIPVAVLTGERYRASLTPLGPRLADLALQLIDGQGSLLGHANDLPGDFSPSPSLTITATSSGPLYLRVTRNDDESALGRYQIRWARTAVSGP